MTHTPDAPSQSQSDEAPQHANPGVTQAADTSERKDKNHSASQNDDAASYAAIQQMPEEIGGRKGPEPTRFGDWEKNGRCIDF